MVASDLLSAVPGVCGKTPLLMLLKLGTLPGGSDFIEIMPHSSRAVMAVNSQL